MHFDAEDEADRAVDMFDDRRFEKRPERASRARLQTRAEYGFASRRDRYVTVALGGTAIASDDLAVLAETLAKSVSKSVWSKSVWSVSKSVSKSVTARRTRPRL